MSALSRWRSKVNKLKLTKKEKEKDLRRSCNIDAFNEFKAKRAEQQRKRRAKMKGEVSYKSKIKSSKIKSKSKSKSKSHHRHNRERRMNIMKAKGRKPFKLQKVNKISVSKMNTATKCVQFIHLNKKEPRGSNEFVFYVHEKFFDKIGVKIKQKLYTEGDGSAHKFILSMINDKTKNMFKTPNSKSVESYVNKGKNPNQKMDYAFFLLFDYLHDKKYVSGHVNDGFKPKYPRNVVATVISQGGTLF